MSSKRKTGSSGDKLFACTNCHKRCKFEDLSSSQQLCKICRKQFPSVTCHYCRLEFHPIKTSAHSSDMQMCEYCTKDFKQHGKPSTCTYCRLQSAFNSKKCTRCSHSEKKYGLPVPCEHCNNRCAFSKPDDVKKKVDGKTLCLLCTISYKKDQFKKKKTPQGKGTVSSSSSKRSLDPLIDVDLEPLRKKPKFETSGLDFTPPLQPHPPLFTAKDSNDLLTSNHILETDRLQNEISSLKKQIAQKDQALIEKDKQICQLKADASEKEREFRTKHLSQQKAHAETIENYQAEIRSLRTQLSKQTQKKSSTNSSDKQNSLASIASSLAATPALSSN